MNFSFSSFFRKKTDGAGVACRAAAQRVVSEAVGAIQATQSTPLVLTELAAEASQSLAVRIERHRSKSTDYAAVGFGLFLAHYREASTQLFGELPAPFSLTGVPRAQQTRLFQVLGLVSPREPMPTPFTTEEAYQAAASSVEGLKSSISCLYALARIARLPGALSGAASREYQRTTSMLWHQHHSELSSLLLLGTLIDDARADSLAEAVALWGDSPGAPDGPWGMLALLNPEDSAFAPEIARDKTEQVIADLLATAL